MSYSKLIHDYLDRQLDGVQEDTLFSELARDPDLRVEFNQQVQIQSVATSDMTMISPPAESANTIFSALGFSIPSSEFLNRTTNENNYEGTKLSNSSNLVNLWKKHLTTIMTVLITAGLTTAVFLSTGNYFENKSNVNIAQKHIVPIVSSADNSNITKNEAGIINHSLNNTIVPVIHRRQNNNSVANNSVANNSAEKNSNAEATSNILSLSSAVQTNNSINTLTESRNINFGSIPSVNYKPFMSDIIVPQRNFKDKKLSLIAGFSNSASSVKVNLPNGKFYQNFNLSAMYKVSDNWYFGVQIGQEQIAQNFQRVLGEGLNYQQNYSFLYYGGLVKYSHPISILGDYSRYASIYGQLFGGSTKYGGVLLRPQIGLSFSPYGMWSFNVGYELINYNYYIDNKLNTTNKYGLIFGTGISF